MIEQQKAVPENAGKVKLLSIEYAKSQHFRLIHADGAVANAVGNDEIRLLARCEVADAVAPVTASGFYS